MNITETPIKAFAFCRHPLCSGYRQEPVDAIRVYTSYSYRDNGGDLPGEERSVTDLKFVDPEQASCANCHGPRELSEQQRPSYQPLSGHDPLGLVNGSVPQFNAAVQNTEADARNADLEAMLAKQQAQIDSLLEKLGGE